MHHIFLILKGFHVFPRMIQTINLNFYIVSKIVNTNNNNDLVCTKFTLGENNVISN